MRREHVFGLLLLLAVSLACAGPGRHERSAAEERPGAAESSEGAENGSGEGLTAGTANEGDEGIALSALKGRDEAATRRDEVAARFPFDAATDAEGWMLLPLVSADLSATDDHQTVNLVCDAPETWDLQLRRREPQEGTERADRREYELVGRPAASAVPLPAVAAAEEKPKGSEEPAVRRSVSIEMHLPETVVSVLFHGLDRAGSEVTFANSVR